MENVHNLAEALNPRIAEIQASLTAAVNGNLPAKEINRLYAELKSLKRSQSNLQSMVPSSTDDADDMEADEAREIAKAHVRANVLGPDSDYYYIHDMGKFLLYNADTNEWTPQEERTLKNHHRLLKPGTAYWDAFMEVLKEDNRWFRGRTASFKDQPGKLNMLRPQLLQPLEGTPHPLFDLLVRSVCGDKPENIEHLERVLVAKWHNPFQYLLPVICFSDEGGTGKSLFVGKVITALFGRASVNANCRMSDFTGQFNGHLAGMLAVLINENCEDSYNHNAIKMIAGSEVISYTNKNQMPFMGDNAALLFVSGNSIAGSIKLDGGDVDRRFSIIKGTRNLESYVSPWLRQHLGRESVSYHEAKEWIVSEGQHILGDPQQVAVWLNHLVVKHGLLKHVPALHSADYQAVVETQTPLWNQCFETVFTSDFNYMRRSTLYEFYRHEARLQGNRLGLGKKKFYAMADKWLSKKRPNVVRVTSNWDSTTADVYIDEYELNGRTKPKLASNDLCYYFQDGHHREWKISL